MTHRPDRWQSRLLVTAGMVVLALGGCRAEKREIPTADPSTRRVLPSGELIGFRSPYGADAWFGIPFAKPPMAELRWRAPRPVEPWFGLRPALTYGTPCPQCISPMGGGPEGKPGSVGGSEDCLYLSVWAPRFAEGQMPTERDRRPVMVWIHGGGNTVGHGGWYDGGNLAATEDVVVVSINYRLGPFGWFRHASLRGDDADELDRSGNFGTLDVARALEWVRDNIAVFGGDPDNVTIFGESAGGRNVFTMLLSPRARGLFHRAVVQSGGLGFDAVEDAENFSDATPPGDRNSSAEVLARLLIAEGRAADRAEAKRVIETMGSQQVGDFLRGRSADEIFAAYDSEKGFGMIRMPQVFKDGAVLPLGDELAHLAAVDGWNGVPVMLGTNRDENKLFMFSDPANVRRILWLIPRLRDERMYNLRAEYLSRMWKATGADEPAAAMRRLREDVYVYRFDWDEEPTVAGADLSVHLGAAHLFEVPFVFGHFDLGSQGNQIYTEENEPGRKQLSDRMMAYWAAFARDGSPGRGGGELPPWGPAPAYMVLDTEAGGGLRMASDTETVAGVVASVARDSRLTSAADRCAVLGDLASWSRGFTREGYAALPECAGFPLPAEG
jgi:para-nitrobenzyl esterase